MVQSGLGRGCFTGYILRDTAGGRWHLKWKQKRGAMLVSLVVKPRGHLVGLAHLAPKKGNMLGTG